MHALKGDMQKQPYSYHKKRDIDTPHESQLQETEVAAVEFIENRVLQFWTRMIFP